jgi:deoxycytidylate deaminase
MKIKKYIINTAIKEAGLSTYKHHMSAIIFNKHCVVSVGRNYPCKSVKHLHPKFTRWRGSVHAEIDCIMRAKRDISGHSILVIRLMKNGELGMAKPCKHCLSYLDHVKIKNTYYSDSKGEIVKL